jgi:hypothetical protein
MRRAFGFIPIVSIRLETCVDTLMREAKKLGAEGMAEVQVITNRPRS